MIDPASVTRDSLAQEGAFARIGLHQLHPRHAEKRQHQPGETGTATQVDHALRCIGDEWPKLRRIEDVAAPRSAIVSRPTRLIRADHRLSSAA